MALPMMSTPTFKTVIPSSEKEITYRPFLVKEEKILLMALEGGDGNEMVHASRQILQSCIMDDIDVDDLTTFDMEYLFLQLRGKSVNEVVDLRVGHTEGKECKHKTDNNVYEDYTEEELINWLEQLNQEQFRKISLFFETLPSIKHRIEWTCSECGEKDYFEVEGLQSFFT
jgi:hypothetical protein